MANSTAERSGMMAWVSSIRMSMANDPGRQNLEDQIQGGFLFLEDYLDDILAGPRHDPLIELLKTPGRKRDVPKKMKVATAYKPKAIVNIDTDEEEGFDKENEAPSTTPANSLHKALLQAKPNNSVLGSIPQSNQVSPLRDANARVPKHSSVKKPVPKTRMKATTSSSMSQSNIIESGNNERDDRKAEDVEVASVPKPIAPEITGELSKGNGFEGLSSNPVVAAPQPVLPTASVHEQHANPPLASQVGEALGQSRTQEVESQCRTSVPESFADVSAATKDPAWSKPANKLPYNIDTMTVLDLDDFTQTTAFTSTQSFHTTPLEHPIVEEQPSSKDKGFDPKESNTIISEEPVENRKGVLEELDAGTNPSRNIAIPSPVQEEPKPALRERSSNEDVFSKPTGTHFPTIGAPSPLRKSMRAPKEPHQPSAYSTASSKQNSTRSSWLVKAREAKAMESNTKHAVVPPAQAVFVNQSAVGMKRKSGEMLGVEIPENQTGRTQKLTKVVETSPLPAMLKDQNKLPFDQSRDLEHVAQNTKMLSENSDTVLVELGGDGSDGMIDKLKKTVAGYSQRTGKSMGKSLGGAAADALAARLAAEAKIAERHAAEWDGIPPPSSVLNLAERAPPAEAEVKVPCSASLQHKDQETEAPELANSRDADRRLSVSDLFAKHEPKKDALRERVFYPPSKDTSSVKSTHPANAADTSTSTTPPHSPPAKRPPVFTVPEKPKLGEDDMDVEEEPDLGAIRVVTPVKPDFFSSNKDGQIASTGGFFSSATKLVTSVLGGSRKGKEPVKSIQLAAAAAKKQQEEADKKAIRLKEMEARRQQALQKKADEERARVEKKAKDEDERYRREKDKEDTTEKRALRQPGKKLAQIEEEMAKKRKAAETEKKADAKKPPSKDKPDPPKTQKPIHAPQMTLQTSTGPTKILKQSTLAFSQTGTSKTPGSVPDTANAPSKAKAVKGKDVDAEMERPVHATQAQAQAHSQVETKQVDKAEVAVPVMPSEAIELPDINSEYSDSDDEDRKRTFELPQWAQSPALRAALVSQRTVDPDEIFGAIKPLRMEELFKARTSRFRARTSSANWAGVDELTAAEENEYARRMGYKK